MAPKAFSKQGNSFSVRLSCLTKVLVAASLAVIVTYVTIATPQLGEARITTDQFRSSREPLSTETASSLGRKSQFLRSAVQQVSDALPLPSSRFANGAANRSPFRSAVSIDPDEAYGTPSLDGIMCFDRGGNGAPIPQFVRRLFEEMRNRYRPIRRLLEEDEWRILIGWVPSRFMGPQKSGRTASGAAMEPPTRGRNPNYYLSAYNSSWHTQFETSGYRYVFQVVHRNALAVCVRERLHVMQIYCSPAPSEAPLIIYHCPCRHCREGISGKTSTTMRTAFPNYHSPLLANADREMPLSPPREEVPLPFGTCVDSLSAPWLLQKSTVEKLPYEGLYRDLDALLRLQADHNRIVFVTIFNKFWIDHLHNYYYSFYHRARLRNIIVATMDREALTLCIENRLPCFDATEFAEFEEDMAQAGEGYKKGHTRKVSEAMSWIKPRLAVAVLSRGYGFFMSDLDLSWNYHPMKDVLSVRADIVHQCDTTNRFSINSGFYFARANERAVRYFKNLMVFTPQENSDQTAMKLFARYDHTHGASNMCLSKWTFNMKCNYKIEGSVKVVNGVETFEWRPYDPGKLFWVILHATCLSGAQAKMLYLRTMKAWFLDELDNATRQGTYCLRIPAELVPSAAPRLGNHSRFTEITQIGVTTQHSEKYTTADDQTFLRKRH